ncbi:uncharacterized protein LOC108096492 [Drosophila ficusphila]|uniref:uncharacterized protein LOC108096492 n=1 Tax=Drosophila ficusphila TaxID=30025 RepID=UPI0007E7D288|nr:uncharacterized protein LOC108096492 [Drosophila ficusphila]
MRKITIFIWLLFSGVISSGERIQFLKDFLEAVNKEKAFSTILLMQREFHKNDLLEGLYPILWPIIRLDETETIELINYYNSEMLCLVYLEFPEDIVIIPALAENTNHMREARIAIFLQFKPSTNFLQEIANQAEEFKFLHMLIIEDSLKIQRLQPFPQTSFQLIDQPFEEMKIFPHQYCDFMGKVALTLPDFVPPRSFFSIDPRTGREKPSGYIYNVMKTFSESHNITLKLETTLNDTAQTEIIRKTIEGELDLPISGQLTNFRHANGSRIESLLGITGISIAVPCGKELSMPEKLSKRHREALPILFITSYILMTSVEAILRILWNRIRNISGNYNILHMVINCRVLRCILCMSIPMGNQFRSVRGQFTMVMSFTGVIIYCMVAAQISTILTMGPQYHHAMNFEELRESNLTVVVNRLNFVSMTMGMDSDFISESLPNPWIVSSIEQMKMIGALNTSYAYQIFTYKGDPFTNLQEHSIRKAFCRPKNLEIINGLSFSSILQRNSIYAIPLREFANQLWSGGILVHWVEEAVREYISSIRATRFGKLPFESRFKALNLQDYGSTWQLVLMGYSLAIFVFIGEVILGKLKRRLRRTVA